MAQDLGNAYSDGRPVFLDVVEVPQGLILPGTLVNSSTGPWYDHPKR
jgi:hypothetical protein